MAESKFLAGSVSMISRAKPARLREPGGVGQGAGRCVAVRREFQIVEQGTIIGVLHDRVPQISSRASLPAFAVKL
jgi:hypothetical protein